MKRFALLMTPLLLLALLEGIVSLALVGSSIVTRTKWRFTEESARGRITRFDPELGWCSNPGTGGADGFGPGVSVYTNPQGIRGTKLFERAVPTGKVRALASGDSFTFGTGVSDHETWCELLTRHAPRLETLNFGVGGYGIDQAYLRYLRDGARFDHDLHFFSFITEDILRALVGVEWGADKPRVTVDGGTLRLSGVPVTKQPAWLRSMRQASGFLRDLHLVQLGQRILRGKYERPPLSEDAAARELAVAIFVELARLSAGRGSELVLVYLPVESEYSGGSADVLRLYFRGEMARHGVAWIDLFDEFRALAPDEHASLYLRRPSNGAGHYNPKGHELVAELFARKMREIPSVQARLDGDS